MTHSLATVADARCVPHSCHGVGETAVVGSHSKALETTSAWEYPGQQRVRSELLSNGSPAGQAQGRRAGASAAASLAFADLRSPPLTRPPAQMTVVDLVADSSHRGGQYSADQTWTERQVGPSSSQPGGLRLPTYRPASQPSQPGTPCGRAPEEWSADSNLM